MPVTARSLIRKMRGGAQAHLLEASDGHSYVVKFHNNPQHRRILVNEWIASTFLHYLGIAAPEMAMVQITESCLAGDPDIHIQLGRERRAVTPGWHFGSRFPGDPARTVVYDFLPDTLLGKVENLADFRAVLAFDKWMGNADSRQAIFFRARLLEPLASEALPIPPSVWVSWPRWWTMDMYSKDPTGVWGSRRFKAYIFARWSTGPCVASPNSSLASAASGTFRKKLWIRRSNRFLRPGWRATKTSWSACWNA
jgi:hypothetical protein